MSDIFLRLMVVTVYFLHYSLTLNSMVSKVFVLVTGASTHSFPFSHRLQTSMQSSGLYMRLALANIPGMKDWSLSKISEPPMTDIIADTQ